jgi:large subunit ribosomal protein L28
MAKKCLSCGKGVMYGHNVSHAKNRTNRTFKPNLQTARIVINGVGKRMKLCVKCLRMYKAVAKEQKISKTTPVAVV